MERGFVLDFTHHGFANATWQSGEPEKKTFLGLDTGRVKHDEAKMIAIATYRCPSCGYLESYARKEN